ncbi:MAG: peptide-methionine (R)-S-oxide reductase [Spiribacter salinus]|uniref:peptide-methionine (R)-S-oxide reductase n=1 Tax=Spiribacter salinus TaxID=1335746 RepID=A0A540VCV9_9GAMM|nr:MAG: peptide-methionine (R)-S-oxide reductase [Spiribacter salinus]
MFNRKPIGTTASADATGVYCCSSCSAALFEAHTKFDSGTGYPSFWAAMPERVEERLLTTYGQERTQVRCASCGAHLGHRFADERTPSAVRYCIRDDAIHARKPA